MKVILIFEIEHDDFDDIDYRAVSPTIDFYSIKSEERLEAYSDLELKLLPKYKKLEESDIYNTNDMWQKIGWNNCLRQIMGEEE